MANSTQDLSKLNRQPTSYATTITCTTLAVIAVVLRLLARRKLEFKYGVDDVLIVLSLCALLAYFVGHIIAYQVGYGKSTALVTNMRVLATAMILHSTAYSVSTALTKISILCFYSRMFKSKGLNRFNWVVGTFVVIYNIALTLVVALRCIPLSSIWTHKPGKCVNTVPPVLALGIINFVTDIVVVCIPIRFVVRLHMKTVRKVQVLGIFMTGAIVCAFGIARVITSMKVDLRDPVYNLVKPGLWSFAEAAIGIVGACLPTMGGYITRKRTIIAPSHSVQAFTPITEHKSPIGTSISTNASDKEFTAPHKSRVSHRVSELGWQLNERPTESSESVDHRVESAQDDHITAA